MSKNYKIILASGSPRRQQFFKDFDLDFEIRLKEVEEIYPDHLQAEAITNYLAELKANAFEGELKDDELVITSDTLVWLNNKAVGNQKTMTMLLKYYNRYPTKHMKSSLRFVLKQSINQKLFMRLQKLLFQRLLTKQLHTI